MKTYSLTEGLFALNPKLVKYIIVHCSATPRGRDIGAAEIRTWHRQRGFKDIGYHFVIRLDGTIEPGRPLGEPGAHCSGKNACSVGICYVGGVEADCRTPADTRTPAQKAALSELIARLRELFPDAEVRGHRDFAAKACPSFDATALYATKGRKIPGVLAGVLLLSLALCGCRTSRDTQTADNAAVALVSRADEVRQTSFELTDSLEIVIEHPVVTNFAPDSSVTVFRAAKATLRKKSDATVTENTAVTRNDSTSAVTRLATATRTSAEDSFLRTFTRVTVVTAGALLLSLLLICHRNRK